MIKMSRLMDIDDLADYLRLKKQTIYNWLHQGKIDPCQRGIIGLDTPDLVVGHPGLAKHDGEHDVRQDHHH